MTRSCPSCPGSASPWAPAVGTRLGGDTLHGAVGRRRGHDAAQGVVGDGMEERRRRCGPEAAADAAPGHLLFTRRCPRPAVTVSSQRSTQQRPAAALPMHGGGTLAPSSLTSAAPCLGGGDDAARIGGGVRK
jgi:hypothetical protein